MTEITREITIHDSPENVWRVLADYKVVASWAPDVTAVHITSDVSQGVGATRLCSTADFGDLEETVTDWQEGKSLTYSVTGNLPLNDTALTWSLRAKGDDTIVRAQAHYEIKEGAFNTVMERLTLRRTLASAFEDALLGFKHHVETGEIVEGGLPDSLKGEEPVEVAA